jgi:hypothetical protein
VLEQNFAVLQVPTVVWELNNSHDALLPVLRREAQLKFLGLETKHHGPRLPTRDIVAKRTLRPYRRDVLYLRAMSAETEQITFRAHTEATVRWTTADALLRSVGQQRSDLEQRFRALVIRARQFYPMPPDLVIQAPIVVQLVDRRSDKGIPLPRISQ